MADWQAIKIEYITTKTSYRKLAEKYGINKDTIYQKAKSENWKELRRQHIENTQTKILGADIDNKVSCAADLTQAARKLLGIVIDKMDSTRPAKMDTQEMRHLSGVLKDIKDILMIKSPKDLEEQDARIAKLRHDVQSDDAEREITVTMDGTLDEFGG